MSAIHKLPLPRIGSDVRIEESRLHAPSGARLILAEAYSPRHGWTACWLAHWQQSLPASCAITSYTQARKKFAALSEKPPPPVKDLKRDWQRQQVYRWETSLEADSALMKPGQMRRAIRHISGEFNMRAPSFRYEKPRDGEGASFYMPARHHILMRHREFHNVLHEVAHALDMEINGNDLAHHGPSFVQTLIQLCARYSFFCPNRLEASARKAGLAVAPLSALPIGQVMDTRRLHARRSPSFK